MISMQTQRMEHVLDCWNSVVEEEHEVEKINETSISSLFISQHLFIHQ